MLQVIFRIYLVIKDAVRNPKIKLGTRLGTKGLSKLSFLLSTRDKAQKIVFNRPKINYKSFIFTKMAMV